MKCRTFGKSTRVGRMGREFAVDRNPPHLDTFKYTQVLEVFLQDDISYLYHNPLKAILRHLHILQPSNIPLTPLDQLSSGPNLRRPYPLIRLQTQR